MFLLEIGGFLSVFWVFLGVVRGFSKQITYNYKMREFSKGFKVF